MYEIKNDGFYDVLAKYPDCIIDYFLIANDEEYNEIHSHRKALLTVVKKLSELFAEWEYDISCAEARKKEAKELLSLSDEPVGISSGISYYRAFLKPPHGNNYTDYDFLNVNNSLFPNGTECVVFYEWTTDWFDYFNDGHEWWGALCLTAYDKSLNRFAVIMASATD